jgi:hypothetical protein
MSQADTEQGHFAGEMPDYVNAYAGILGCARPRRDHDTLRLHSFDFSHGDLVISAHLDLRPKVP